MLGYLAFRGPGPEWPKGARKDIALFSLLARTDALDTIFGNGGRTRMAIVDLEGSSWPLFEPCD